MLYVGELPSCLGPCLDYLAYLIRKLRLSRKVPRIGHLDLDLDFRIDTSFSLKLNLYLVSQNVFFYEKWGRQVFLVYKIIKIGGALFFIL